MRSSRPSTIFAALAAVTLASSALAQDEKIIESSWFSTWGEAKYEEPFDHLAYVNPDAPKGGKIVIGTVGTFDSMNPYATLSGSPGALSTIGVQRILMDTADDVNASYCLLCTTMEYPESEDWVIFHLRDDVYFSDGTQMTAEDVAFSFNLLLEQATPSFRESVKAKIPEAKVVDEFTVRYDFAPDVPRKALILQAGATPVWSKKWFEDTGARLDEKRYEISPGTGPYMLSDYKSGEWIEYKRNPDYWGIDHPLSVGRENYDVIRIEYYADTIAAFEAFKAGEVTFRRESSSLQWATGYDFPALEKGWVVKKELPDGDLPAASGFVFNLDRAKFQDRNVRRALGLMYNFTWTNDTLQYGLFQQRESFWENENLKATGLPEGLELEYLETVRDKLPEEIFTEEAFLPHTSGARPLDRGNLRRALAFMEAAGYAPGDDGLLRNGDGETLDVELLNYNPAFDRIFNPYIENLQQLGVNATYNRVDANQYQARTQSFDYDLIYDGYTNGLQEGTGIGQRFGTRGKGDIFNPASYGTEAVDALIDFVIEAKTYDEMAAAVRAIDRVLRYDYFVIPTWYLGNHWVAYYDMYEHPPVEQMPPFDLGYYDFWWVNADKEAALRAAGALKD